MASTIALVGGTGNNDAMYTGYVTGWGQCFEALVSTKLANVYFWLKKTGSPTGNVVCKIYTLTGTYGSATPNTLLATSDNLAASTLFTSYGAVGFTLSGAQKIDMTATTRYFATVEYTAGDGSNNVGISYGSNTYAGNLAHKTPSWGATPSDMHCEVYGDDLPVTNNPQILNYYYISR